MPWGHIIVLLQKVKDKVALEWYALNTLQNNISRDILIMQIEQDLYGRQGKNTRKVSNFLASFIIVEYSFPLTKNVNERNQMCTLLAYDEGHDVEEISNILKLSQSSIYDYIRDYESKRKTINDKHLGKDCKLNEAQETELKAYLSANTFTPARSIVEHILQRYQIKYSN